MTKLVLFRFTIILILLLGIDEATLFSYERSSAKKLRQEKAIEAPYVCLEIPTDLPPCNFNIDDDKKTEILPRRRRAILEHSTMPLDNPQELSSRENIVSGYTQAPTVVYKFEGCVPSRLPFVLPICDANDFVGKVVDVQILLPFKVTDFPKEVTDAPVVFPEFDIKQWRQFMKRMRTRFAKNKVEQVRRNVEAEITSASESQESKISKGKKFEQDVSFGKKTIMEKSKLQRVPENFIENDRYSKILSATLSPNTNYRSDEDDRIGETTIDASPSEKVTSQYSKATFGMEKKKNFQPCGNFLTIRRDYE